MAEVVEVEGTMGTCTSTEHPDMVVEEAGRGVLSRRDRERTGPGKDRTITMTRRHRTEDVDRTSTIEIRWMGLEECR